MDKDGGVMLVLKNQIYNEKRNLFNDPAFFRKISSTAGFFEDLHGDRADAAYRAGKFLKNEKVTKPGNPHRPQEMDNESPATGQDSQAISILS